MHLEQELWLTAKTMQQKEKHKQVTDTKVQAQETEQQRKFHQFKSTYNNNAATKVIKENTKLRQRQTSFQNSGITHY